MDSVSWVACVVQKVISSSPARVRTELCWLVGTISPPFQPLHTDQVFFSSSSPRMKKDPIMKGDDKHWQPLLHTLACYCGAAADSAASCARANPSQPTVWQQAFYQDDITGLLDYFPQMHPGLGVFSQESGTIIPGYLSLFPFSVSRNQKGTIAALPEVWSGGKTREFR